MAARFPATTIGRCSRTGWVTMALAISARLRSAFFFLSALNSASPSRISAAGSPPTMSKSFSTSALLGGSFRYSRMTGATPFFFRSSSVSRDLLQRGLCQIVMVIVSPSFFPLPRHTGEGREGESLTEGRENFRSEILGHPDCGFPPPALRATSPVRRGRYERTRASLLVQCVGVLRIDHLFGNVEGEASAGHRGEVAEAPVLAVLLRPEGSEAPSPRQRYGRLPFTSRRIGVEFLVQRRHRQVERLAVDAGMLELLARQPARGAAPMQRARLGLGELLVVDGASFDELRDDRLNRLLDVLHDRRVRHLGFANPPTEHAPQALGRRRIAFQIERGGVLQVT